MNKVVKTDRPSQFMKELPTLEEARGLDLADPLSQFRERFHLPKHEGEDSMYFTGNSLGLQPKAARQALEVELEDWATYGVEGHFQSRNPWVSYHERFVDASRVTTYVCSNKL